MGSAANAVRSTEQLKDIYRIKLLKDRTNKDKAAFYELMQNVNNLLIQLKTSIIHQVSIVQDRLYERFTSENYNLAVEIRHNDNSALLGLLDEINVFMSGLEVEGKKKSKRIGRKRKEDK